MNISCVSIIIIIIIIFTYCNWVVTRWQWLTPHGSVLLEKSKGPQPIKKFPAIIETRMFNTVFTTARLLSLHSAR